MESPEVLLGKTLMEWGLHLAVAESCTGGLIANRITNVPGASAYFVGSMVTYSNDAKSKLLGVDAGDLAREGAVSEVVARQMVEGVLRAFGADCGVAVTGIAGPGGGTSEKPVGLVYIAAAGGGTVRVERHVFRGGRESIKDQTADRALNLVRELVE